MSLNFINKLLPRITLTPSELYEDQIQIIKKIVEHQNFDFPHIGNRNECNDIICNYGYANLVPTNR